MPNLTVAKTSDGLYHYMSGSYKTFEEAANAKTQLMVQGYGDAFITAYQKGNRIPLDKAGATYVKSPPKDSTDEGSQNAVDKNQVTYKVQLGVFKNDPPADFMQKINSIQGIDKAVTNAGLTRYTAGNTSDFKSISATRDDMKAKGFSDAFIIAFYKGEQITIQEALELQK
ncbi:MAG TPA: hypothetical protein VFU15_12930 [Bacteroidia bacterium]|nr:hypothetical protein [Bacteroidia bacterium]